MSISYANYLIHGLENDLFPGTSDDSNRQSWGIGSLITNEFSDQKVSHFRQDLEQKASLYQNNADEDEKCLKIPQMKLNGKSNQFTLTIEYDREDGSTYLSDTIDVSRDEINSVINDVIGSNGKFYTADSAIPVY